MSPAAPAAGMAWRLDRANDGRPALGEPGGVGVPPAVAEEFGQGLELGGVAGRGGRPVGLDQPTGGRVEAGVGPGPLQGQELSPDAGLHQRHVPAVGRHAEAGHQGVDPVAVPLGVGPSLEDDHARPLADQQAVGPTVEGPDDLARAERTELAEHAPQGHVVAQVDAAGQDQVRPSALELPDPRVHGQQGAGAGAVHRVRRPPEVQAVGDPGGDQVRHEVDGRLGMGGAELAGEGVLHLGQAVLPDVGEDRPYRLDQLLGRPDPLLEAGHTGRQVPAPSHDHRGPLRRAQGGVAPGVVQRAAGHPQGDQLVGLHVVDGVGHDAEGRGVEAGQVAEESAPAAVETVHGPRVGIVEDRVPPVGWDLGDHVAPGDDVLPELVEVTGPGEQGRHADDGDIVGAPVRRRHDRPDRPPRARTWRPGPGPARSRAR